MVYVAHLYQTLHENSTTHSLSRSHVTPKTVPQNWPKSVSFAAGGAAAARFAYIIWMRLSRMSPLETRQLLESYVLGQGKYHVCAKQWLYLFNNA